MGIFHILKITEVIANLEEILGPFIFKNSYIEYIEF